MKKLILAIFAFVAMSIFSSAVSAQAPTRIQFRPGATESTVSGKLNGYYYRTKAQKAYVIRVKKGQTLTTEDVGDNMISVKIDAPKGSKWEQDLALNCNSGNEVTPTDAGDYKIYVTECTKGDAWKGIYKLKITVH